MRLAGFWGLFVLVEARPAIAQTSAGAELWRLAAVTIPLPPVLATGAAAVYWNPAQSGPGQLGVDFVQTPQAVGATGVLAALRVPAGHLGSIGFLYARMGLGDLVRTTDSPDPVGTSIPFYSQRAALTWTRGFGSSTLGTAVSFNDTKLDGTSVDRWTLDIGFTQQIGARIRIAAATRGLRRLENDPAQDVSGAIEYQVWTGTLWRGAPGALLARYGLSAGHSGGIDHQLGLGLKVANPVALDVVLAREASYGNTAWRGAAGLRVAVGRYRMSFARDGGISDLGSSFRVGLEATLQ